MVKKKYWAFLILLFVIALDWYIRAPDSYSRELTQAIEAQASEKLKAYPYNFWVMKVKGETAFLSTPRSFEVPAFKALGALYPDLNTKDPNNPAFIAAEQLLGEVQAEARQIVLAQPGIREVRWELDRDWVIAHYIDLPQR